MALKRVSFYLLPAGIFALTLLYSSFFLQGLRLVDNDYNVWIRDARMYSLPAVLWQIFNPVLHDWNVYFRPTEVLIFKGLFSLFQYDAAGYFYFKGLVLAAFCTLYFLFLRHHLNNAAVAALSALFIGTSASTFTSTMWVSDFVLVSEFLALAVYWLFLNLDTGKKSRITFWAMTTAMVVLTLICDRTKANGKLIPGILFLYVVSYDFKKLKTHGLAIAAMLATILPWKILISNPAPFLVSKTTNVDVYAWQPASLGKFWTFFASDFQPLSLLYGSHPPVSVLAILGFPLVYGFGLALVFLGWRSLARRSRPEKRVWFLIVWFAVNAMALMSYPRQAEHFQARYAISVLIPLVPLVLLGIYTAAQSKFKRRWIPQAVLFGLVVLQIGFNGYQTIRTRNDFPSYMIASDTLRDYVAENFKDTWFFYLNAPVMAYRPTEDGNMFFSSFQSEINAVANQRPPNTPLYLITLEPVHGAQIAKEPVVFPGKSATFFDRIFNHEPGHRYRFTFYLYQVKV